MDLGSTGSVLNRHLATKPPDLALLKVQQQRLDRCTPGVLPVEVAGGEVVRGLAFVVDQGGRGQDLVGALRVGGVEGQREELHVWV